MNHRTTFKNELSIALIDPHPSNPRSEAGQGELDSLAESVKTHGLLQPVVVRAMKGGRYQLIAGGRRLRAAKAAKWKSVPATIRKATDGEALTLALVENIERQDLNPVETARAVAQLCAPESAGGCGLSQVDVGAKVSRDPSWVRRQFQLLKLPDVWLRRLASGEINAGMSQSLVAYLDRPAVLARVEDDMIANPWAWRTTQDFERNVKLLADEHQTKPQPAVATELKPMRAVPGTGERKRDSRAYSTPSANGTPAEASHAGDDVVPSDTPSFVMLQLLSAIALIDNVNDLNRISKAVQDRRVAIKRQVWTARRGSV
jgi:ParB family chromosome partitioning protein